MWLLSNMSIVISGLAMLVSFLTVIHTRSNIKIQKYIETITTQRIKWIESLRNDLSEIVAGLHMLRHGQTMEENYHDHLRRSDYYGADQEEVEDYEYRAKEAIKFYEKIQETSRIDVIKKVDLSILRLNPKDDILLIEMLENVRERVLDNNYRSADNDDYIANLRDGIATVLKSEWEKIKLEVKKGRVSNVKKRQIESTFLP